MFRVDAKDDGGTYLRQTFHGRGTFKVFTYIIFKSFDTHHYRDDSKVVLAPG